MSPNTLDQLADRFINYLVVEKGLSRNTVTAYSKDLLSYLESLRTNGISDIVDADMALVLRHLIDLRDAGLGPRSRARHLVALRGFYRFLVQEKILDTNPAQLVDLPKVYGMRRMVSFTICCICLTTASVL